MNDAVKEFNVSLMGIAVLFVLGLLMLIAKYIATIGVVLVALAAIYVVYRMATRASAPQQITNNYYNTQNHLHLTQVPGQNDRYIDVQDGHYRIVDGAGNQVQPWTLVPRLQEGSTTYGNTDIYR